MADEGKLKYIDFEYNGTKYTMEFNRRSAEFLEKKLGMNIAKTLSGEISVTDLPGLFRVSLMMHHPKMKVETADMLFDLMGDKNDLMVALCELLAYCVNSVFEEPEEGKAISWERH